MSVQLAVVKSSMVALSKGAATGPIQALGLLPKELELITGDVPWRADQRIIVSKGLHTLMYSTMDTLGLQRFEVPAEYVAATIAMFVQPTNVMVACSWLEADLRSAAAVGNPNVESIDRKEVKASQLFGLCLQMFKDCETIDTCRTQFENRVNMAINRPIDEETQNAVQKLLPREERKSKGK